ncbi:ribosomal protein S18-alanine N-acetyltransferase [Catenovulum sp. 2E275]|uniref:ribosomal protein S18-alanine N-acetyltransferase n=1 Tax=Catenovulum sp. 2E275 TaxID=2980497 RepID=UPI0021CED296|nr:ribosomal protein S18-alanine N-acetyltransferase [Catenovulum sp. 2E275]MCU4674994.1 ribosomal protein S18-alanine N-acetyltransferase [Catenovulum sp. 2E275]
MTFSIRPFTQDDIEPALAIELESQPDPWSAAVFQSCLNQRYINLALVNEQNQLIGFLISDNVVGEISLMNICIATQYRRQGLAKLLLNALIEQANLIKAAVIWLEVRQSNLAAQNLYFQLGFNQIAIRQKYYSSPIGSEHALVMSLNLF